ncbi:hypothetical protein [Streptomyces griseorubiginosus]|uniref:hypothetical protein n=1 Tax=Streptomyces griseorubiginosus TaxID=67304 RepID=UPI0036EA6354
MSAGTNLAAGATEIEFAPAAADDVKIKPGIGYLQPGGLVVHTGWSSPPRGEQILRQHPAYEGGSIQPWTISTPDGIVAARFPYLTRPDAEAAAARISTALPGGRWPTDGDTAALLPLLQEASNSPDLLPLAHKGRANWGSGYGGDIADFYMPDTRAEYEAMIAAHGKIPKACHCCARQVRVQKKNGYLPRTNHWPAWKVHGRRPGDLVTPHCSCGVCLGIYVRIGAFGPAIDEAGNPVVGSKAVWPGTEAAGVIGPVPREERAFAWFQYFLLEAGHVVIDERDCEGLWPRGVRHDDALFCETGETCADDPAGS